MELGCQKKQQKIFYRTNGSLSKTRAENKGAGIGLLLVRGFLERSG
jgi:two-component system CheB/CheR fusion protein